ncbi:MAG: hypothetical protein ACP5MZ_03680 [Candidatus Micrarchaeia archaeon]
MQIGIGREVAVHSNDAEVENRIKHAIRNVSENRLGNALVTGYRDLEEGLRRAKHRDGTELSISYSGKSIEFTLELKDFDYLLLNRVVYMNSNETYSIFTVRDMRMIEGLEHYVGVSGGLTQVLTHVSILQDKNYINTIRLCDLKQEQLVYNALELVRYDALPSSFNLLSHIDFINNYNANMERGDYKRMKIANGTRFELSRKDFAEFIDTLEYGSRSFLYSSNVYQLRLPGFQAAYNPDGLLDNCWNRWGKEQEHIIDSFATSSRFANGSALMAASPDSTKSLIMERDSGEPRLYSYCASEKDHSNCVHPSLRR